ncbi:MAG TPA: ferric reductase-like transmembrane domain-containing protein [Steroidobacteraceae bacterium]|nr:ferric reductase-like transmembrane domain-containing protein [Steroidobacteraceae bacterium]
MRWLIPKIDTRYALWGTALVLLALTPALAGFAGLGWELCQVAGLAGAVACLALSGSPIRPRSSRPPTLLSLQRHTLIGWLALIAVALHVAGLLLVDRTVIEYLKPTAPLYQFAGIAATTLLVVLMLTSLDRSRRRLFNSHRDFQATHVILGCLICASMAVHIVVTARYLGGRGRRALFAAAAIGAILMLLRRRRGNEPARPLSIRSRQLVFGRHSTLIVGVVAIGAAAIAGLLPDSVGAALREPLVRRATALPLDFPHGKHGAVNCLTCHHNYADRTGSELCIQCHRGSRADLKEGIEARFHGFCLQCHRHPQAGLTHHGPVSGCIICHHAPSTEE